MRENGLDVKSSISSNFLLQWRTGRPFVGLPAVLKYFELLASLLTYENMDFSSFVVDPEVRRVACRGRAVFKWLSTGESWDETFAYIIDFDEGLKVTDYQVWADSGAAYLASQGKLNEVREKVRIVDVWMIGPMADIQLRRPKSMWDRRVHEAAIYETGYVLVCSVYQVWPGPILLTRCLSTTSVHLLQLYSTHDVLLCTL